MPLSETENIGLLEQIVSDQRQILTDVFNGTDVTTIPQLWCLCMSTVLAPSRRLIHVFDLHIDQTKKSKDITKTACVYQTMLLYFGLTISESLPQYPLVVVLECILSPVGATFATSRPLQNVTGRAALVGRSSQVIVSAG